MFLGDRSLTITFGSPLFFALFGLGILAELLVPYFASKAKNPPFNKHHIMERFGLLNIIVMGEVLLSAALAIQAMSKSGHWTADLIFIAIAATIVPFALWWLYFNNDENLHSNEVNDVYIWAYTHFFIFTSAAAVGSGFAALVDASGDHPHGDADAARWTISLAIAIYMVAVWLVRDRHVLHQTLSSKLLGFAVLIALTPLLPVFQLPALVLLLIVSLTLRLNNPQYKLAMENHV